MKALVTGSAGFIGTNLVRLLTARGDEVVGIDQRTSSGTLEVCVRLDLADRRNLPEIARWTAWADVVFHLAARSGIRTSTLNIDLLRHRDIIVATEHIMATTPRKTHIVVTSSSSVYGGAARIGGVLRPSSEDDCLSPRGRYAQYKAQMEAMSLQYRRPSDGLTIARPFTVIGEHQRDDMAMSLWIDAVDRQVPITIFGGLDRSRDVTDVQKVVGALVAAGDLRYGGVVNLGSGQSRTLADLLEAVFDVMGRQTRIDITSASREEVPDTLADTKRVVTDIGVDLSTDLRETTIRQVETRLGHLQLARRA